MKQVPKLFFIAAAAAALTGAAPAGQPEEPFTPAEYAAAIQDAVSGCTVRAALGPVEMPLPLETSNFLLDHPDLAAFLVHRRKIAPYRVEMLGVRRWSADDGDGTQGVVSLIEESGRHRRYYAEGVHRTILFQEILMSAVVDMDLSESTGPDSRPRTMATFHVWVRLKNRFVSGVVKTLRPFLQGLIVGKFNKAFSTADSLARLMVRDPDGVSGDVRAFSGLFAEDRAALLEMIARLKPSAVPPSAR